MKKFLFFSLLSAALVFILLTSTIPAIADDLGKRLVQKKCAACHKFEGKAESRFKLKAPDLMWGGSKLQRKWLIRYLTGKEGRVYKQGYRWDNSRKPAKHMVVKQKEAEAIADYFKKALKDPRVKANVLDLSRFSEMEAALGEKIFKEHSCIACHQIEEDGKALGGSQSTSFLDAGKRLNVDWVYRFNMKPPDFVPHSGEFEADVSELGLRYVTGFIMTLGVKDFKFYEPWNDKYFKKASTKRGAQFYKEYCAQCHGFSGKGDGPAALDLKPKPAIHAQMAIDKEPIDYLFNVIYYGGKNVGKSALMPYWGITLGHQGVADVIAYMRETFKGQKATALAKSPNDDPSVLGACPQVRKTHQAPSDILGLKNPLEPTEKNLKKGKILYLRKARPLACKHCHGLEGDGKGYKAVNMIPPPRNFTCAKTMKEITDGQMFWIIKNGSKNTEMQAYDKLKDTQVWQLVLYLRKFSK
ncbi:MAG: cytochrome c [Candidatus Nitronauta litoralis]|uniref:Cytochrome c n=1 Tax=Candidatus Nitronauta litoralis TaxID=2705533 RepID=A0A7T0BWP2_9BACT|nr:MAG: cytochrome c [Candidatus Nitronauta litoralis]